MASARSVQAPKNLGADKPKAEQQISSLVNLAEVAATWKNTDARIISALLLLRI